jgi:hypothetical protein
VKLIYIAGHIDGMEGSETQENFERSRYEVEQLRGLGLEVFYCEAGSCHWDDVLAQAPGAKALVYRGHGVYRGEPNHPETVGGFNLMPGEFARKEQIADGLRAMAPGWVVMLPGSCFAAGQSGPEWDQDIGLEEAKRRVATYSEDFLAAGAACYFAGGSPVSIMKKLLAGRTCGEAVPPELRSSQLKFEHPGYPGSALWLGRWGVNYTDAFVGNPDARLP